MHIGIDVGVFMYMQIYIDTYLFMYVCAFNSLNVVAIISLYNMTRHTYLCICS